MENLSKTIAEIAQAVFPIAQRRSKDEGETITFNVEVSSEGGSHHSYIMTVWEDCLVQTRISHDDEKAIILGRRGRKALEARVESSDMEEVYDQIDAVTRALIEE